MPLLDLEKLVWNDCRILRSDEFSASANETASEITGSTSLHCEKADKRLENKAHAKNSTMF